MKTIKNTNDPKSLMMFLGLGLLTILVMLTSVNMLSQLKAPKVVAPELNYAVRPTKTSFKVGEKVSVPVYLTGKDVGRASAFDIKFYYDDTKLRLVKAVPGGFFEKYITIKWDQKENWFALALTPSNNAQANSTLPMLTLEFTAVGASDSTQVTTNTSIVYLTNTGGFHPTTGSVNLTIK